MIVQISNVRQAVGIEGTTDCWGKAGFRENPVIQRCIVLACEAGCLQFDVQKAKPFLVKYALWSSFQDVWHCHVLLSWSSVVVDFHFNHSEPAVNCHLGFCRSGLPLRLPIIVC